MSSLLSLSVHVITDMTSRRLDADLLVDGNPNELLIPAVERAIIQKLDPNFSDRIAGIEWDDPEYPERLIMIIPEGMTLGATAEYFGDEATSVPATIRLTDGGYGGDGDVGYLIDLVNFALTGAGWVTLTLAAQRRIVKARYAKYRHLAKDWNDSGRVSRELHEAVCSKPSWSRTDFDRTFGLNSNRGPELLRNRGYQRHDYEWGEYWERTTDNDAPYSAIG